MQQYRKRVDGVGKDVRCMYTQYGLASVNVKEKRDYKIMELKSASVWIRKTAM